MYHKMGFVFFKIKIVYSGGNIESTPDELRTFPNGSVQDIDIPFQNFKTPHKAGQEISRGPHTYGTHCIFETFAKSAYP